MRRPITIMFILQYNYAGTHGSYPLIVFEKSNYHINCCCKTWSMVIVSKA